VIDVVLPKPDGKSPVDVGFWRAAGRLVTAEVDANGRPYVRLDGQIWLTGEAEAVGLALVAASRLAVESAQDGDQDGQ
jgi:hypothetical protein